MISDVCWHRFGLELCIVHDVEQQQKVEWQQQCHSFESDTYHVCRRTSLMQEVKDARMQVVVVVVG